MKWLGVLPDGFCPPLASSFNSVAQYVGRRLQELLAPNPDSVEFFSLDY
jgi:hypothetical protein